MNSTVYSIFFHNYYGQLQKCIQFFSEKMTVPFNLFYNIGGDSIYTVKMKYYRAWYKRFGHILKVITGKGTFRSLFRDDVKKYKD